MQNFSTLLSTLIANPAKLIEQGDISRDAPRLLGIGAIAAMAVGAASGSQHTGPLWLYSAIKMPLVFLVPPLFIVPALRAGASALQMSLDTRRTLLAALATSARAAVFGAALSPLLWLFSSWDGRYRVTVFLLLMVLAVAGRTGVAVLESLVAGQPMGRRWLWTGFAATLFALMAGQTGWHLAPFVLRPNLPVVFLAPIHGDVLTTLQMRLQGPPRQLVNPRSAPESLDPATQQQLRSLGYMDNSVVQ